MWCPENLGLMGNKVWGLWVNMWDSFLFVSVCKGGSDTLIIEVSCKELEVSWDGKEWKHVSISPPWVEISSCPTSPIVSFWKLCFSGLPDLQPGSPWLALFQVQLSIWDSENRAFPLVHLHQFCFRGSWGHHFNTQKVEFLGKLTTFKIQAHIRTLVSKNKLVGDWWMKMISL